MTSKYFKEQARESLRVNRSLYQLFYFPIAMASLLILLGQLRPEPDLKQVIIDTDPQDLFFSEIWSQIFPNTVALLLGIFGIGILKSLLPSLDHPGRPIDWRQPFESFSNTLFPHLLRFSIIKHLTLSLWGLPLIAGSLLATFNAFRALHILLPKTDDQGRIIQALTQTERAMMNSAGSWLFLSLGLLLIGLLIYLPRHYAYAQADYILAEQLTKGRQFSTFDILRQSRELMRGHRLERFKLDLSFLPWYFLNLVSLGILQFYLIPYTQLTFSHYYLDLRKKTWS